MVDASPAAAPIVAPGQVPATPAALNRTLTHYQGSDPVLHAEIARQAAARGYAVPPQHTAAATAGMPATTSPSGPNNSPPLNWNDAAAYADDLVRGGMNAAAVKEVMDADGHTDWEPDNRTPAQVAHDRSYGVQRYVDPTQYQGFQWGEAARGLKPGELQKADEGFRNALADMGYSVQSGSGLLQTLIRTGAEIGQLTPDRRAAVAETWQKQIGAVYPTPDALAEAQANASLALGLIDPGNSTFKDLEGTGLLRNPNIFVSLANRGAAVRAWRDSRPK